MRKLVMSVATAALMSPALLAPVAQAQITGPAASDMIKAYKGDVDCHVWLCFLAFFDGGSENACDAAFQRFLERLVPKPWDYRPPLPRISECPWAYGVMPESAPPNAFLPPHTRPISSKAFGLETPVPLGFKAETVTASVPNPYAEDAELFAQLNVFDDQTSGDADPLGDYRNLEETETPDPDMSGINVEDYQRSSYGPPCKTRYFDRQTQSVCTVAAKDGVTSLYQKRKSWPPYSIDCTGEDKDYRCDYYDAIFTTYDPEAEDQAQRTRHVVVRMRYNYPIGYKLVLNSMPRTISMAEFSSSRPYIGVPPGLPGDGEGGGGIYDPNDIFDDIERAQWRRDRELRARQGSSLPKSDTEILPPKPEEDRKTSQPDGVWTFE